MAIAKKTPAAAERARAKRTTKAKAKSVKASAKRRRIETTEVAVEACPKRARRAKVIRRLPAERCEFPTDPDALLSFASEELLARYLAKRDDAWRDALVERHLPDVVDTARCLIARLPRSVDVDDLCNAGYSGLLRCVETFRPEKGRSFLSYLKTRVYGAMVDELRAMDWLPRLMRSRLARRDQVADVLRQEFGREPSEDEIAASLDVSLEQYRRSYPSVAPVPALFSTGSQQEFDQLDGSVVGIGAHAYGTANAAHPLTSMYQQELIERIHDLLSATEWQLVELHYFKGLKLREVAKRLRLSPARICQIHGQVLQRLKERLREEAATI